MKTTFYRCAACDYHSDIKANVARHCHRKVCSDAAAMLACTGTIVPDDEAKPFDLEFFTRYRLDQYHSILTQRVPYDPPPVDDYETRARHIAERKMDTVRSVVTTNFSKEDMLSGMFQLVTGKRAMESHRFIWTMNDSEVIATYMHGEIKIRHIHSVIEETIRHTIGVMFEAVRMCAEKEPIIATIFLRVVKTEDPDEFLRSIDVYPIWMKTISKNIVNLFVHA